MTKKLLEINPFVSALEIKAVWRMKQENSSGGEAPKQRYDVVLSDTTERCTVYTPHLLHWFKDLSTSAKDMFLWIAMKLRFDSDIIEITEEAYCKDMQVSRNTFYTAKQSLTNRLIVPRTSRKNTYWINPSYLFKGDRLTKYPERIIQLNEHPMKNVVSEPEHPYDLLTRD